jgi:hypothetical protein
LRTWLGVESERLASSGTARASSISAERPGDLPSDVRLLVLRAPIRPSTARLSSSSPSAHAAWLRTSGSGSQSVRISGSTARGSSISPSAQAAAARTAVTLSRSAASSAGTASAFSISPSAFTTASRTPASSSLTACIRRESASAWPSFASISPMP